MERAGFEDSRMPSIHLPPRDLWLFDPTSTNELLQTPLDERGLVDPSALIALMKSTVDPEYKWQSSFTDIHHLQWPDAWYERTDSPVPDSPHVFRNLAISKLRVPRVFHNWVHRITEPPPLPSDEVMKYRIEAQSVAIALFRQVRNSKAAVRKQQLGDGALEELLIRRFDAFAETFETAKLTPREFQLINYSQEPLHDTHDMVRIGTKLGRFTITASATDRVRRKMAA